MRTRSTPPTFLAAALLMVAGSACTTRANYLDPAGPRYAGDYGSSAPAVVADPSALAAPDALLPAAPQTLKVVSYNVRYGEEVDEAIEVLAETPELADADVYLLQEMNASGVDRIARALGCSYVYYPATLRTSGREFGNAVLTRGRILEDRKVLLPHLNPFNRQQRIAVGTDLELGDQTLQAYSVHTETPFLPVGSRADQVETLLSALSSDSGPCLIAGDFNTMAGGSLQLFEETFSGRGFERASAGLGSTFAFGPLRFSMDHVFVRGLEVVDAGKVEGASASDHVPIWVELAAAGPPAVSSAR